MNYILFSFPDYYFDVEINIINRYATEEEANIIFEKLISHDISFTEKPEYVRLPNSIKVRRSNSGFCIAMANISDFDTITHYGYIFHMYVTNPYGQCISMTTEIGRLDIRNTMMKQYINKYLEIEHID